jgi:hypothetical protein
MVSRVLHSGSAAMLAVMLACSAAGPALAADATIQQVYDTAKSGDTDGSLAMMAPVLKDHPGSAKAHYVEAELLARANRLGEARTELAKASSLDPGLAGISSHSVRELEAKLNATTAAGSIARVPHDEAPRQSGISWGLIALIGLVLVFVLALLRRRSAPQYAQPYGGPTGYTPGYGAGPGPGYGGMGYGGGASDGGGLLGGLARGAAIGAGFAVGEEVIEHMIGGERGGERYGGGYTDNERPIDPDADMGGNDFGISDAGSWDDSGSGGGGDGW